MATEAAESVAIWCWAEMPSSAKTLSTKRPRQSALLIPNNSGSADDKLTMLCVRHHVWRSTPANLVHPPDELRSSLDEAHEASDICSTVLDCSCSNSRANAGVRVPAA